LFIYNTKGSYSTQKNIILYICNAVPLLGNHRMSREQLLATK